MAGESGPDRSELVRAADQGYGWVSPAGEVMEARGGRSGFGVEPDSWMLLPAEEGEECDLFWEKLRSR